MSNSNKSFTLIEILVVIVIIGIISAFIIVSMAGVSQKAIIAKGQAFSSSLKNALMMNLVSEWKFDESSGITAYDFWGTKNGTRMDTTGACDATHCPQIQTTGCISNNCLLFDGINDWVNIGSFDQYENGFSVSLWFKNISISSRQDLFWAGGDKFILAVNSSYVFSHYARSVDGNTGYINSSLKFNNNNWFFVVLTYSPVLGKTSLYINGIKDTQEGSITGASVYTSYLRVGTQYNYAGNWFNGYMDELRVYDQAVPTSQVQEIYYSGLNNLLVKNQISSKDYGQRTAPLEFK
ncbi:MAG: LamG domain-containing protein [Candidatus Pacebacteria bacterium]|nr:LamG domain-containing protein [Candidatus Paceibacterota bacterium]MDD5555183.1 LamG domain-containing protein [Candidatus Paceibacterota bacterium]